MNAWSCYGFVILRADANIGSSTLGAELERHMDLIKRIEIQHFRSLYKVDIKDLSHINVFSGLNDVGKSNVIRALNLFFNNRVDRNTAFDFQRDTNTWHLHRSSAGHNKRALSLRITFRRPSRRYEKSLPDEFWIDRFWDLQNQLDPITTWGSGEWSKTWADRPRALTEFMNRSHFFYVPAIRDRDFLRVLLLQFSESVIDQPIEEILSASETFSKAIFEQSALLRRSLNDLTGLDFVLRTPNSLLTLLEASRLFTEDDRALELRGDGIQGLAVAAILAYLTTVKKNDFYYWGFEEPENSLEYIKSTKLADVIEKSYSRKAQIFISTHSPAFLTFEKGRTSIYRVAKLLETEYQGHFEETTVVKQVHLDAQDDPISDELGFFDLVRRIDKEYREYEVMKHEYEVLKEEFSMVTMPVLIVEGENDAKTLCLAWETSFIFYEAIRDH